MANEPTTNAASVIRVPRRALIAFVVVTALVFAGFGVLDRGAGAQSGPTQTCSGDQVLQISDPVFGWSPHVLKKIEPISHEYALATPLAPGTYEVDTVAYDGHEGRDTQLQPNESYYLQFLDAGGAVLATSGATPDLADLVLEAEAFATVGPVSWESGEAVTVRTMHAAPNDVSSADSVIPICVGISLVPPPTTTAPPTSEPPTTEPPTTEPPTIEPPATEPPTTVTPTTVAPPTTVPTEVEPAQEEREPGRAAPASPVTARPAFTG